MNSMESAIKIALWSAQDAAFNLDFIPDDKLDWKPSPEAKSALEVSNEIARSFQGGISWLESGKWGVEYTPATTRDAVKTAIKNNSEKYAQKLREFPEERLSEIHESPMGTMSTQFTVSLALIDVTHHHGQIKYIQSLLGDAEDHFVAAELP
jgi:uncharacterized damage-inducible protein DinB